MANKTNLHNVRDGKGTLTKSLDAAERAAQAARLRSRGYSYDEIAAEMGYTHRGTAYNAVQRALKDAVREAGEEVREVELDRLDYLYRRVIEAMEAEHVTVSNGRVVNLDGTPVRDYGPVFQAIDRALRIQERRAKLLGLDTAMKLSIDAENLGAEIGALIDQLTGTRAADDDSA